MIRTVTVPERNFEQPAVAKRVPELALELLERHFFAGRVLGLEPGLARFGVAHVTGGAGRGPRIQPPPRTTSPS